jgi:predicted ATPase/signal transduction histidine kinase
MLDLPGYVYRETVFQGTRHTTLRCVREHDGRPVMVKVPRADHPSLDVNAALKHEFEIARRLQDERVLAALALEPIRNGYGLVTEDFGGLSLSQWRPAKALSLEGFLTLAIRLTDILSFVHGAGVIHKDIKVSNFIVSPDAAQVKLTDFGIAALLPREHSLVGAADVIEGTLAYMSPEQTGRMNRSLDHRSDLYSLGVTFYRLLTGRLPFTSEDPLELVYCHLAEQPTPPHEIDAAIPRTVSRVLLKLLAKIAEERYQSAFGVKADLERCLALLQATGRIDDDLALGARDISARLRVPQTLYGRAGEVQSLLAAFDRVAAGGVELVLVSGYSGIGKSALVGEVSRPITAKRGFFLGGKFDQFRRDIPYSGLIQAFRDLAHKLLTGSPERVQAWRTRLLAALGSNGQDIVDLIPEIELVIGAQPRVADHGSAQSQARFHETFRRFVRAIAQADHPLVLFLDDLQWADGATLELLRSLITDPELAHVLFLGAYRDNEVDSAHPLRLLIDRLRGAGTAITPLVIAPLTLEDITRLLSDTLQVPPPAALDLARIIASKTLGNPFFVIEFLMTIHRDELLRFDAARGGWQWDVEQIRRASITDNVVELMSARIGGLEESTRRFLELAACMGSKFDLRSLSIVAERSPADTAIALQRALLAEMIVPLDAGYKYSARIDQETAPPSSGQPSLAYRFRHDRIQQAAYQRIAVDTLPGLHLRIGRLILRESAPEAVEERLFEIVNHLNAGTGVLEAAAERRDLAALNLRAARKAKTSAAYGPALALLATGFALLPEDAWRTDYELTFALVLERAQAAYLATAFDEMEKAVELGLSRARDALDEASLHEVRLLCHQHRGDYLRAIETALRALDRLSAPLPAAPTHEDVAVALTATMAELHGREIEALAALPDLTDAPRLAEMRLLVQTISSAYFAAPALFALIVFRMIQITIRHGLSSRSAYAFSTYGWLLVILRDEYDAAHRFGRLSMAVMERFQAEDLRAKIHHGFSLWIQHYKEPVAACMALGLEGIQSGLATGDIEFASYGMSTYSMFSLLRDETLASVAAKTDRFYAAAIRTKHQHTIAHEGFVGRTVERLQGVPAGQARFSGAAWAAESEEGLAQSLAFDHCFRALEHFLLGEPARVLESAAVVERHFSVVAGMGHATLFTFYQSLACLALAPEMAEPERARALAKVEENQRKTAGWAAHAPFNYAPRYHLVEAEQARVQGHLPEAMRAYERAIVLGREAGFLQELALTYELSAKFYLALGLTTIAHTYLRDAHHGYLRWGANAVTARLEREFPGLLSVAPGVGAGAETSTALHSARLDLDTMLRAAQAISMEIVLSDLLRKLLALALENAGAQRAILVLAERDALVIGAESTLGSDEVPVLTLEPIEACGRLAASIVHYAAHTGADVVIDNAAEDERFLADPYVQRARPRSVLATPLAHQGKLIGVLYLENGLATGVFSQQRVEMVRVMAGQAAIAIENARLYESLDNRVKEQTRELRESNEELSRTLSRLQATQKQLVAQEKLASLGALTSGIAHEIKNPLNFVMNFAQLAVSTADELAAEIERQRARLEPDSQEGILELTRDLQQQATKVNEHGTRANDIVAAMLQHSRAGKGSGERREVDVNALLGDYVKLAGHDRVGTGEPLNAVIETAYDAALRPIELVYQDVGRVFLNVITNAAYAVRARRKALGAGFTPTIRLATRELGDRVEVRIRDNGGGIPAALLESIFVPFFTTKPPGEGTGLGLSISREIIVDGHGGTIDIETREGDFTEFILTLPRPRA